MEHLDWGGGGGCRWDPSGQLTLRVHGSAMLPAPLPCLTPLSLMLLSEGHSTGNLFEILPGYVAFCNVEQHIWDLLAVWECHWLMCLFFSLSS